MYHLTQQKQKNLPPVPPVSPLCLLHQLPPSSLHQLPPPSPPVRLFQLPPPPPPLIRMLQLPPPWPLTCLLQHIPLPASPLDYLLHLRWNLQKRKKGKRKNGFMEFNQN